MNTWTPTDNDLVYATRELARWTTIAADRLANGGDHYTALDAVERVHNGLGHELNEAQFRRAKGLSLASTERVEKLAREAFVACGSVFEWDHTARCAAKVRNIAAQMS